jgi:hypothetical protein
MDSNVLQRTDIYPDDNADRPTHTLLVWETCGTSCDARPNSLQATMFHALHVNSQPQRRNAHVDERAPD